MSHLLKSRSGNSAFTLVELMIVIAIIGILASLATVGVMKVLERSKMVTARIEIGQLEAAVSAAKLDLGNADELPSLIYVVKSIPDFASTVQIPSDLLIPYNSNTPVLSQDITDLRIKTWTTFQKVFGRNVGKDPTNNTYYHPPVGAAAALPVTINWPCNEKTIIQGMQAYMFWLGGMYSSTGGKYSFSGFSTDKRDPCEMASPKRKGPYFDFDSGRVKAIGSMPYSSYLTYVNGWDGEYTYFSNSSYKYYFKTPPTGATANSNSSFSLIKDLNEYGAKVAPYVNGNVFFNAKTFQIIGSGQNQMFGPGGSGWTPGSGLYAIDANGYDDLSNFSSTQLGKKDE